MRAQLHKAAAALVVLAFAAPRAHRLLRSPAAAALAMLAFAALLAHMLLRPPVADAAAAVADVCVAPVQAGALPAHMLLRLPAAAAVVDVCVAPVHAGARAAERSGLFG